MKSSAKSPARRRSGGGGFGFLLLIVVIAGAGTAWFLFPQQIRGLLGIAATPKTDGPPPAAAQGSATDLAAQNAKPEELAPKVTLIDKAAANAGKKPVETAKPLVKSVFADDAKAKDLIAQAEKPYRLMRWNEAASVANRVAALDAKPELKARAADILEGSKALPELFEKLGADRDELTRNFDTHPSLVLLHDQREDLEAVPIVSGNDKQPVPVEQNPLQWIEDHRKMGSCSFLIRGKKDFIPTTLDSFGKAELVDQAATLKLKRTEFTSKLTRLRNSSAATSAIAWYEAGKFAYRNRLDDLVVDQLDRAVQLDDKLVVTVREDKAASLFALMVVQVKNNNRPQAATYMKIIDARYKDTDQGQQARLFYDGKSAELLIAAKEADARRGKDEADRRAAALAKAKDRGDTDTVAQLSKAQTPDVDDDPAVAQAATGDMAEAEKASSEGHVLLAKAIDLGNTDERDVTYHKAQIVLTKAVKIWAKLAEASPNDTGLQEKMRVASLMKFQSIKMQRFH